MTGGPPEDDFERQRDDAIRGEAERAQRQAMLDFQAWMRRQPPPEPGQPIQDPLTVARIGLHDGPPGVHAYVLGRWSLLARMATDAAWARSPDQVQLGYPLPGDFADPGACPPGGWLLLGHTTADGQWHPARPRGAARG
jgi:hypothetical protein